MRILLDESMPTPIRSLLAGHVVQTVVECGWEGISNGKLLAMAAASFDVMLTADRNIKYQQNLKKLPIAVIVLATSDGLLPSFQQLVPKLLIALTQLKPRTLIELHL